MWKRLWYCWVDTCPDTGVIDPPEEWLMSTAGDTGLVQENLLLDLGDSMQTDGTTPPGGGGGGGNCLFFDTVLTWYIVSNGKVLAEYDGLTKHLNYKYMYAGDQRIAMRDGQNRLHYYLNDHLGSARVLIDSAGTIKDKYHYLAYGSPLDVTFSTGQPNRYTGKPYDMDAGMNLYYYGARYYDAELGRFTQVDPLRNKYPAWGAYVYTLDNPMNNIDPDGNFTSPVPNPTYRVNEKNPNVGKYGYTRKDNKGRDKWHNGVDLVAPKGTKLVAEVSGIVIVTNTTEGGNTVKIVASSNSTDPGITVGNSHMDQVDVKDGQTIQEGEQIGTSGTTGNASGLPDGEQHVHVTVRDSKTGETQDPANCIVVNDPNKSSKTEKRDKKPVRKDK